MPVGGLLPSSAHVRERAMTKVVLFLLALVLLIADKSCRVEAECLGRCVRKDLCRSPNSTVVLVAPSPPIKGDPNAIDLRVGEDEPEPECKDSLETCCEEKDIIPSAPRKNIAFERCGVRNQNGIGYRLVGNKVDKAQYGEFPWTLMILKTQMLLDLNKDIYVCAASLIAPDVAVTAAHCMREYDGQEEFTVRAGEWDTSSSQEIFPIQTRRVSRLITHEKYNELHHNNIALLKLDKPFEADENIQIVCLPPPGHSFTGQECFTGAWGKDRFENGQTQNILRRIEVPVIAHDKCQSAFRTTRLGPSFNLDDSYMCAGGEENVDACTGDGGAPLVCAADDSERYYQAGIVAWGIGCGQKDIPGAYTDISKFVDWIQNKMTELGSDVRLSQY